MQPVFALYQSNAKLHATNTPNAFYIYKVLFHRSLPLLLRVMAQANTRPLAPSRPIFRHLHLFFSFLIASNSLSNVPVNLSRTHSASSLFPINGLLFPTQLHFTLLSSSPLT